MPQPKNCEGVSRKLAQLAWDLLRSLGRQLFLDRRFTKCWASHLLHNAEEVLPRRDRDLYIAVLRWDRLSGLPFMLVVIAHHDRG